MSESATSTRNSLLKIQGLRACGTCVKAKVKCVPNIKESKCVRCQRLDKVCLAPTTLPQKPIKARATQLEKRFDSLVDLLASQGLPVGSFQGQDVNRSFSPSGISTEKYSTTEPRLDRDKLTFGTETGKVENSSIFSSGVSKDAFAVEPKEAESLLLHFRNFMTGHFPFVVIQPHETSASLRVKRPFLWKAIMTAASHGNLIRQIAMGKAFVEELTTQMLILARKSLDMLQGLLIHIAWYHYHTLINPQTTNFLHLSKSLVGNLGLDSKWPVSTGTGKALLDNLETFQDDALHETDSSQLEEWRALAGCFYLTSIFAGSCLRMEPIQLTPYITECTEALGNIKEYSRDSLLLQLIRLRKIALRVPRRSEDFNPAQSHFQMKMQTDLLQEQLKSFMISVPPDLQQSPTLLKDFHSVQISLYESALHQQSPNFDNVYRLTSLTTCLLSTKSLLTLFLVPTALSRNSALTTWVHYGSVILMAFRLCVSPVEGWDPLLARIELDFNNALSTQIVKIEGLVRPAANGSENDIFVRFAGQLRKIRSRLFDESNEDLGNLPLLSLPVDDFSLETELRIMLEGFWHE